MYPKFRAHSQPTKKSGASPQEWRNVENMAQFHKNGAMEILHGQGRRNHGQKRCNHWQKRRIPTPKSKTIFVSQRTAHARNFSGNQMKHCFARPEKHETNLARFSTVFFDSRAYRLHLDCCCHCWRCTNWYRSRWAKLVQPLLENGPQHRQLAGAKGAGPPGGPPGATWGHLGQVQNCLWFHGFHLAWSTDTGIWWYLDLRKVRNNCPEIKPKSALDRKL